MNLSYKCKCVHTILKGWNMNILFFILLLPMFFVFGCTAKYEKILLNNIAEARQFMYVGEKDNVKATFICGCREKEYIANGIATELQDFGVITFFLDENVVIDKSLAKYILIVGTKKYDGTLETNPFDGSLVADIGKIIDKGTNITAKLIEGEYIKEMKLSLISDDWNIQYNDVVDIVIKNYKKEIKTFIKDDVLNSPLFTNVA